jgi:hypothetical protein
LAGHAEETTDIIALRAWRDADSCCRQSQRRKFVIASRTGGSAGVVDVQIVICSTGIAIGAQ